MAPLPETSLIASISRQFSNILKRTSSPSPSPYTSFQPAKALLTRGTGLPDPGVGVTPPTSIPNNAVFALFGLIGVGFVLTSIWFFFWAKNGGFYFKADDWDDYKSTVLRRKGPNGTTLSGATESTDLGGGSVVHGEGMTEYGDGGSRWGRKNKRGKKRGIEKAYKDFDENTEYTGTTISTESEMAELKAAAKAQKKFKKESGKKYKKAPVASTVMSEDIGTVYEDEDDIGDGVKESIRAYRHEKPARVGGLNKESDGSAWDGSTNDASTSAGSELLSHRERTPTTTPTKVRKERKDNLTSGTGGIRKVVSTSGGTSIWSRPTTRESPSSKKLLLDTTAEDHEERVRAEAHDERIRAEARKLQEKGRAAQRSHRDFSFNAGDDHSSVSGITDREREREARREERERRRANRSPTKKIPGGYIDGGSEIGSTISGDTGASSDLGTKSYHHPIPGLSSTAGSEAGRDYAEEKRKRRAGGGDRSERGYRRERRDSLE
jgi:hypothetical protein